MKKGLLSTRENGGEGVAGEHFWMLKVSGSCEGIKGWFSKLEGETVVLKCIIHLDCSSRIDKMPLLVSGIGLLLV